MTERLLLLGGTFNPVHIGHARLALECQARVASSRLAFVPCHVPPHKPEPGVAPEHRQAMAQLLANELNAHWQDRFAVETYELTQSGPSYTVNTLAHLKRQSPNRGLIWLVGMDALAGLDQWHQWQSLLDCACLLVVNRPGAHKPETGALGEWIAAHQIPLDELPDTGGVAFVETTPLSVSSSALRAQLAQGLPGHYLIPEPVRRYIDQHQLYTPSQG